MSNEPSILSSTDKPSQSTKSFGKNKPKDLILETIESFYPQMSADPANLQIRQSFLLLSLDYLTHKSECFVCKFTDVVIESLVLFVNESIVDQQLANSFKEKLAFCLGSCSNCLKLFYEKQTVCIDKYNEAVQLDLYSNLTHWTLDRLLVRSASLFCESNESLRLRFILEILINPILIFTNESLHDAFVKVISSSQTSQPVPMIKDLFVGEFLLFFHAEPAIRKWVLGSVSGSAEKKLKALNSRSMEFVAQCMSKLLLEDMNLSHFLSESNAKLKSFCYLLLYGFGTESFYFKQVFPFDRWFGWFCPQAIRMLQVEPTASKIIFRGLISCFNFELDHIVRNEYVDSVFVMLKLGYTVSSDKYVGENALNYDSLSKAMESIFYPTFIRFFTKLLKLGFHETCKKAINFIRLLIYEVDCNSVSTELYPANAIDLSRFASKESCQLRIMFYHFLKLCNEEPSTPLISLLLHDLTLYSNANPLNMSAAELIYHWSESSSFTSSNQTIFNMILANESPHSFPSTIHFLLWKEFGKYFLQFVNSADDTVFIRYVKYFSAISVQLPELPIDEYLKDEKFVFSLVLLLNSSFEIIRSTTIKICVKKLGFIAQNFIYNSSTRYILDAILSFYQINFDNVADFSVRLCDFLDSFVKSVEISKSTYLPYAACCFWILFNHILSHFPNQVKFSNVLLDITIKLFSSLLTSKDEIFNEFIIFKEIADIYAKFKLENSQFYSSHLVNMITSKKHDSKACDLLCLLIKFWTRAKITLPQSTISHLKIIYTATDALSLSTKSHLKQFIDQYDKSHVNETRFNIHSVPSPVTNFSHIQTATAVLPNITSPTNVNSPSVIKQITLDDLVAYGKNHKKPQKHVTDLTVLDNPVKKEKPNPNFSLQMDQMKSIGKEFLPSLVDKPSNQFVVEIVPNQDQPHRSVKLIDSSSEFKDPNLKQIQKSIYQENTKRRLNCDLSSLFKTILAWDHNKLESEKIRFNSSNQSKHTFSSFSEYEQTFEPLLLMEAKEGIARAMEEMDKSDKRQGSIISVAHTNEFTDILFDCSFDAIRSYSEHDYLIVQDESKKHSFSAIVVDILPKYGRFELKVRAFFTRVNRTVVPELRESSEWSINLVCNLVTIIREYQALKGLAYVPVRDFILNPFFNPQPLEVLEKKSIMLERTLNLNHSQAIAVAASVINESTPFTLIQGPPGTGKTKTILSIVGLILSARDSNSIDSYDANNRSYVRNTRKFRQILLCAPSNAAVDELVRRIKINGLMNENGETFCPKLVRFGTMDNIHEDVKDVTLDQLIEKSIGKEAIENCEKLRGGIKQMEASLRLATTNASEIDNPKAREIKQQLQGKRNELKNALKKIDESKQTLRSKFLSESDIICCTLSGSGHDLLAKLDPFFDTVIIDEACQCVETSSLIPMKYKCRSCILVGDPNQLPPTVLSSKASNCNFETSLFQRVQSVVPESVFLLSIQYRMHPEIALFPSTYFYMGKLENGPNVGSHPDFAINNISTELVPVTKPYVFFNVSGTEESGQMKSYRNIAEVECAISLVKMLCSMFGNVNFYNRIGIITPYKQQQHELRRKFMQEFGTGIVKAIDINTVDAFQGQEKDIIIFSCVRAGSSVGFLADTRRLNVALTRAKSKVFILGNAQHLLKNMLWNNLINDAKARNSFYDIDLRNLAKKLNVVPAVSFVEPVSTNRSNEKVEMKGQTKKFVIAKPTARK